MSIAVAAGVGLAGLGAGCVFNYTKSEYVNKIGELERIIAKLNDHLTDLRTLRGKIVTFWDDSHAQETMRTLDDTINQVINQMTTAENLCETFRKAVDSLDSSSDVLKNAIEDAKALLGMAE